MKTRGTKGLEKKMESDRTIEESQLMSVENDDLIEEKENNGETEEIQEKAGNETEKSEDNIQYQELSDQVGEFKKKEDQEKVRLTEEKQGVETENIYKMLNNFMEQMRLEQKQEREKEKEEQKKRDENFERVVADIGIQAKLEREEQRKRDEEFKRELMRRDEDFMKCIEEQKEEINQETEEKIIFFKNEINKKMKDMNQEVQHAFINQREGLENELKQQKEELNKKIDDIQGEIRSDNGKIIKEIVNINENLKNQANTIDGMNDEIRSIIENKVTQNKEENDSKCEETESKLSNTSFSTQTAGGYSMENIPSFFGDWKLYPETFLIRLKSYTSTTNNFNDDYNRCYNKIMELIRNSMKGKAEVWFAIEKEKEKQKKRDKNKSSTNEQQINAYEARSEKIIEEVDWDQQPELDFYNSQRPSSSSRQN